MVSFNTIKKHGIPSYTVLTRVRDIVLIESYQDEEHRVYTKAGTSYFIDKDTRDKLTKYNK